MTKKSNINSILFLILISLSIFSFKWIISYYYFQDSLSLKIIFDTPTDGYFYYIYTEALSSLNFNESFDPNIKDLNNVPLPFYAIIISSILFKLFGFYSILMTELIFIFIFLLIFFYIFKKFQFTNDISILLSLVLLALPSIIVFLNLESVPYLNSLNDIFFLRYTRPLVSNAFFYIFILQLLSLNKENTFNDKNFILLGSILAFSLSSFYYFFLIQLVSFVIFLIYQNNLRVLFELKKFRYYIFSIITFLVISIPFFYFMITSDPDYKERLYLIDLDPEKKKILLEYFFNKILTINFFILFGLITLLNFLNNYFKKKNFEKINIFYIIFIGTILSPFIFISLSSKSSLLFYFPNLIITNAFFYIFFFVVNYFYLMNKYLPLVKGKLIFIIIVFLIFIYNFNIYKSFKIKRLDNKYVSYRMGIHNATQVIRSIGGDKTKLLTFDPRLMVWAILNDVKNINLLSGLLVPKTHNMIENDLIEAFKFLDLDTNSFLNFFENKKSSWRLFNHNTQLFFWGRYSASSLKTYKNSKNFSTEELNIIKKTSPLNVQSIAIPREEFIRLENKFNNYMYIDENKPNIIVLNFHNNILKKSNLKENFQCKENSTKNIKIFVNKELQSKCQKTY
jgi:hypothetical protein